MRGTQGAKEPKERPGEGPGEGSEDSAGAMGTQRIFWETLKGVLGTLFRVWEKGGSPLFGFEGFLRWRPLRVITSEG